jgi:hypothetical protein
MLGINHLWFFWKDVGRRFAFPTYAQRGGSSNGVVEIQRRLILGCRSEKRGAFRQSQEAALGPQLLDLCNAQLRVENFSLNTSVPFILVMSNTSDPLDILSDPV